MKKIMKIAFVAAFAAVAGYGVYANQQSETMSDLMLANVEALEFSRKLCNLEENIHISIQNRLSLCYNRLDETVQPLSRQNMQAQLAPLLLCQPKKQG